MKYFQTSVRFIQRTGQCWQESMCNKNCQSSISVVMFAKADNRNCNASDVTLECAMNALDH
eukprot:2050831-Karenia_brevis.AAC.1